MDLLRTWFMLAKSGRSPCGKLECAGASGQHRPGNPHSIFFLSLSPSLFGFQPSLSRNPGFEESPFGGSFFRFTTGKRLESLLNALLCVSIGWNSCKAKTQKGSCAMNASKDIVEAAAVDMPNISHGSLVLDLITRLFVLHVALQHVCDVILRSGTTPPADVTWRHFCACSTDSRKSLRRISGLHASSGFCFCAPLGYHREDLPWYGAARLVAGNPRKASNTWQPG